MEQKRTKRHQLRALKQIKKNISGYKILFRRRHLYGNAFNKNNKQEIKAASWPAIRLLQCFNL